MERTFVMVKPDGVKRRLAGKVMRRIEETGLKIVAAKVLLPKEADIEANYPNTDGWFLNAGNRSLRALGEARAGEIFGTFDPIEIGKAIRRWIIRFMTSGRVVLMVVEGNAAVEKVRKIAGETDPLLADPGSLRFDLSMDSVTLGNVSARPMVNVLHCSGTVEEAQMEIDVWFNPEEIVEYKREGEETFFDPKSSASPRTSAR